MALYTFGGKIVKRGSGYLSNAGAVGSAPASPEFLTYAAGSAGQAVLTWIAATQTMDPGNVLLSTYPVTSQVIYYNTDEDLCYQGASGVQTISGIAAGDTSRTISSITAGVTWFSIAAVNAKGEGMQSAAVKVTVT